MAVMLEAALDYASKGIPVFPCGDDKKPLTSHGFKDATTNPAIIRKRWTRWPNALVAMPTGPESGISVMDLDKKNNRNGFKAVPDWRKRSKVISRTMSKGAHLFFKDSNIPSTTSKIADGVDSRGKGGYVILPPSKGYRWINGKLSAGEQLGDWPNDLRPPARKTAGKRIKTSQPLEKADLTKALDVIPSDNYQTWFEVGCALYRELGDDGFELFDTWSKRSDKYKVSTVEAKWAECEKVSGFTAGTIFHYADEADPKWRGEEIPEGATLEDFVANMPMHNYIYLPTNQSWPAVSVNARMGKQILDGKKVTAATWLDKMRSVQSITWSPGDIKLIRDKVVRDESGWVEKKGDTTFNEYTPPTIKLGDPNKAGKWVALVRKIFPGEAEHIFDYLAQRVQQPGEKINHAMIFGGAQGIGKDTILEGVRPAVGHWNFQEASPKDMMSRFNSQVKSVILRINEARDMGEISRYDFYESMKQYTASPPTNVPCEEKYQKKYYPANVVGIIYTTNHKAGGIYLPPEDRRHFVAWSNLVKGDFIDSFWSDLYAWYRNGGWGHIAAYLHARDISKFDTKVAPPRTEAFLDMVEAGLPSEDKEFSQAIELLEKPVALHIGMIKEAAPATFRNWLSERRNWRAIPHRLETCGYVPVRSQATKFNRWQFRDDEGAKKEESIFSLIELSPIKREEAAKALVEDLRKKDPNWLKVLKKNKGS